MTHDPLCPFAVTQADRGNRCGWCDLAACVREDEGHYRQLAAQQGDSYNEGVAWGRAEALRDAVEAVSAYDQMPPFWWKSMFFGGRRARSWCQHGWEWGKRDAVAAIEALGGER